MLYQLCFYVPVEAAEKVKSALFAAGAGQIGQYQQCCWQTLGQGQFKPSGHAKPAIGELNNLEHLAELKVEMVCEKRCVKVQRGVLLHIII